MKQSFLRSPRDCLVVGAAFVIGFFVGGTARLSGLLFVAFLERYHVGREIASIPFVVTFTFRNLLSPITGYLGTKFGPSAIVLSGCILASTGVVICFFAEDFMVVIISWGIIYGLGYGLGCALVPQILSEHFPHHFDKASGLYLCSMSIAGAILPLLGDYSIKKYGVSGSFLILASALLHTIPAAMILATVTANRKTSLKEGQNTESHQIQERPEIADDKIISTRIPRNKGSPHLEIPLKKLRSSTKEENDANTICHLSPEHRKTNISDDELLSIRASDGEDSSHLEPLEKFNAVEKYALRQEKKMHEPKMNRNRQVGTSASSLPEGRKRALESFRLFLDPTYVLMLLTQGVTNYVNVTMWTVIVDVVRDHGVEEHNELHVLEVLNVFEFLGRILLGHITDSGYISKTNFLSLCFVCLAVLIPIFACLEGFVFVMVAVSIFGLFAGFMIVVGLGIVQHYVEKENSSMGFAAVYSVYGLMSFSQPPLVGFFRESLQSYDGLFYLLGAMCFISSILNLLIPRAARYRDKKKQTREK